MPLSDLVGMLGRRSGLVELFNLPGESECYTVALEAGRVLHITRGVKVLEPLHARSVLMKLLHLREGSFEFVPCSPPPNGSPLNWPLEQLLLSLTSAQDERTAYRPYLPDPRTRFQVAELDVWLEEPLWSFWQMARPLLSNGASAVEISQKLSIPVDETLYYLHKLRLAGKVSPVRAYSGRQPPSEQENIFKRLLNQLLGRRP